MSVPVPVGPSRREWIPVILLALATFVFNTTEFAPIALLSGIASDFSMSVGQTGIMVTIYAWMVALLSLPLMLIFSGMERRKLLMGLFVVFIISHAIAGVANNFNVLLISRVGIACAHAIFWAIIVPLGVRVAPKGGGTRAMGILSAGTVLAMVLGLPLGRVIGLALGWRVTFWCIGGAALVIMIMLCRVLPKLPSQHSGGLSSLPGLLKRGPLLALYLLTLIMVIGQFTGYTYIEPFLRAMPHGGDNYATGVLLLFGGAGILGCWLFIRYNDLHPALTIIGPICITGVSLLLLQPMSFSAIIVVCICLIWGAVITTVNLAFQSKVLTLAPDASDVAMAMYSGIYNIGIGAGAFVGGTVQTHLGIGLVELVAGIIVCLSAVWAFYCLHRFFRRAQSPA